MSHALVAAAGTAAAASSCTAAATAAEWTMHVEASLLHNLTH
jgi:hypothetical protein